MSPGPNRLPGVNFGVNVPTSFVSYFLPLCMSWMGVPAVISPETTRTYAITPRKVSKTLSNTSAFRSSPSAPFGMGNRRTTASRTSGMPWPVFALTKMASSAGMAKISSSCRFTPGMSALGRSILLITGIRVRPSLWAKCTFATVCASTPWAASTTRSAPSHAASERETS